MKMEKPHIIYSFKEFLKEGRSYYYYHELDTPDCEEIVNYVECLEKALDKACKRLVDEDKMSKSKEQIKKELMMEEKTKFELDLLKVCAEDGDGDEDFENVNVLISMRMKGYYKDVDDGITVDELIERYENA